MLRNACILPVILLSEVRESVLCVAVGEKIVISISLTKVSFSKNQPIGNCFLVIDKTLVPLKLAIS